MDGIIKSSIMWASLATFFSPDLTMQYKTIEVKSSALLFSSEGN